jgi:hypothetical protein
MMDFNSHVKQIESTVPGQSHLVPILKALWEGIEILKSQPTSNQPTTAFNHQCELEPRIVELEEKLKTLRAELEFLRRTKNKIGA